MAEEISAVSVRCWKLHTCVNCQSKYRYQIERSTRVSRSTKIEADEVAHRSVLVLLEKSSDAHPCPVCGSLQPEMIPSTTLKHFLAFVGAYFIAAAIGTLTTMQVPISVLTIVALGALIVFASIHIYYAGLDPNRDLQLNLGIAAREVTDGKIELVQREKVPATSQQFASSRGWSSSMWLLLVFALACVSLAEAVRVIKKWPLNDDFYPPIVGAGDSTKLYFQDVDCLGGYWTGDAVFRIDNSGAPELRTEFPSSVKRSLDLTKTIYLEKENHSGTCSLGINVAVPLKAEWKTIPFDASLNATLAERANPNE